MVRLVAFLEPTQNTDGVINARLTHVHLLETTFQSGIFLNILAELVECSSANHAQLAACQHGLEHIACIHRTFGCARTNHGVHLVDKGDDLAFGFLDFFEHGLEAFLEFAAVFSTRNHGSQVKADQGFTAQGFGDVAGDHALSQPFDHGGFADAGFTNKHGVVLGTPGKHLHHAANFGVSANHGVEFTFAGERCQVGSVLFKGLEGAFGVRGIHGAVSSYLGNGLFNDFGSCAQVFKRASGIAIAACDAQQQHFGGNVGVTEFLSVGLRTLNSGEGAAAEVCVLHRCARCLRQLLNLCGCGFRNGVDIELCGLENRYGNAFSLIHQCFEDVRRFDAGVTRCLRVHISGG